MVGDREFTLQIQTYGGDCITRLENLRSSLQMESVLDTLRANGIVFVNHFLINDTTELLYSRFEKRVAMDVLFRIGQDYQDNLGLTQTVEVEEVYQDASGSADFNSYEYLFQKPLNQLHFDSKISEKILFELIDKPSI